MATIVAAAGGGNWTTGGTWVGGNAPSAGDDAQLIGTSGPVTVDSGAVCRSLDCTGYTGTLTHSAAVTLTIGTSTAGLSNIALNFVNGMTYALGDPATSAIAFVSTSATVQTVNFSGKTTGNVTYNAASNGSWQMTGTHNTGTTATVKLTQGTLNVNGQTCTWGLFDSNNTNVRTLDLTGANITITNPSTAWTTDVTTNCTITTTSFTVTLTGSNANIAPGGVAWAASSSIIITGGGTHNVYDGNNLGSVTYTGTASKTNQLLLGASRTISGSLTVNGNSTTNRVLVTSYQVGTTTTLTTNGTNTFSYVDIMDIHGAGTASWDLHAITGLSGDCGGNSGITFTSPVPQTWSGTSGGNWSSNAWTTRVPLPQDDVTISSAFSASQTITADMPRLGKSISWTGTTGNPTWSCGSTANTLYGSVTLISGMSISGSQSLTLAGRSAFTLTSAGVKYTQDVSITAPSGTYTLQDALYLQFRSLALNFGAFNSNGFSCTMENLNSSNTNTRSLTLGATVWTLQNTSSGSIWNVGISTGMTFSGRASTIIYSGVTSNTRTFAGGGLAYGTLTHTVTGSTGTLVITGSNSFNTINFSDTNNARTLQFTHGTTTTITGSFNVQGTPLYKMTVNSDSAGSAATLTKTSGIVSCDYLSVQDSTASGGATWYAGSHSTLVSDDSGWLLSSAPQISWGGATPVWAGLGVNYKANITNWNNDIAYFKSISMKNIRVHMPGSPQPWNSATNSFWRYCAQYFHAAGFWVTWGTSQSPVTSSNWQSLHDSVVAEAQYLQTQNIVFDEYELGNEYEGAINITVSSLTQAGGTATCTTSGNHGFVTGENVTVYGASPSGYNGTFSITKTGSTTFTFAVSGGLSSPATGTIRCYSMSIAQLNANLRQLATDVKAVYSLGKVSYACWNNTVNGTSEYSDWIANGLGDLDTISIHPYSNINTGNQTLSDGGFVYIAEMIQAFGDKCYVSETGLDAGASNLTAFNVGSSVAGMRHLYNDYLIKYLEPINSKALFYMWSGYLNQDDQFAMQLTTGTLIQPWGVLTTSHNPVSRTNGTRSLASNRQSPTTAKASLFFNGANTDSEITPSDSSILQIGTTSDYTVGGRVKLAVKTLSPNNDNHTIANCDLNYGSNLGYEFQVISNTGALSAYSGSTNYVSGPGLVQYGTWQSVIYRITGTTLDAFVQGQKVWTTTIARKVTGINGRYFGTENTGIGTIKRRVYGNAREFFAVKSPLSDSQIQAIALHGTYPAVGVLYKLDEGSGSTANDSSGNSNNGSITNASWSIDSGTAYRTNLITDPSIELSNGSGWWSYGQAGTITGLTKNFQDTTHVLYGTYAVQLQVNTSGQYYLNKTTSFTPIVGTTYTFSAYVYVPIGSLITKIGIGIRDYSSYNYVVSTTGTSSAVYATLTPGQWTRLSYSATGGSLASGSVSPTWRFTVADPQDANNGVASFTTPQSYWVDGTMLETSSTVDTYFDGSTNGGSWTGTTNNSTSVLAAGRFGVASRDLNAQ